MPCFIDVHWRLALSWMEQRTRWELGVGQGRWRAWEGKMGSVGEGQRG